MKRKRIKVIIELEADINVDKNDHMMDDTKYTADIVANTMANGAVKACIDERDAKWLKYTAEWKTVITKTNS